MGGRLKYDYDSMDRLYEDLKRKTADIENTCEGLISDAQGLLSDTTGGLADGYNAQVIKLRDTINHLNDDLATRTKRLQDGFDEMRETDVRLGDGISR